MGSSIWRIDLLQALLLLFAMQAVQAIPSYALKALQESSCFTSYSIKLAFAYLYIHTHTACGVRNSYMNDQEYQRHVPKNPYGEPSMIPDEQRLLDHIMRGYEKSVRPVKNSSSPVVIQMGLTLTQVLDMDEKNQVLITNVWLDHEWMDEFLVWDPLEFNNITKIRIPCQKIWLPDMVLYNNAAEYTDGLMPAKAMVTPDGNVFWPVPTKLQSSCKVDVSYFPFDSQVCRLKFGSWTYDGFQVDVTNRTEEVDLSNYIKNGEWELIYVRWIRNVVVYACCAEPFPDVTFYIKIRRRTLYYMYNVVFPCVMMSALTLLVFCLPPDSGEKIALGITVLLAFSVFMLAVAENLPETSEFVPLISIYLTIVMALTSVSVIMTVFVLNLHHRGPDKHTVPGWIRKLLLGKQPTDGRASKKRDRNHQVHYSCMGAVGGHCTVRNMNLKMTLENLAQEIREEIHLENGRSEFDSITTATPTATNTNTVTPTTASKACTISIPSTASTTPDYGTNSNSSSPSTSTNHTRKPVIVNNTAMTPTPTPTPPPPQQQPRPTGVVAPSPGQSPGGVKARRTSKASSSRKRQKHRTPYEDALLSLTKLLDRHETEDMEYDDIQDWRRLAQIVDRILFTFFLFATISSTLGVLVVLPATQAD